LESLQSASSRSAAWTPPFVAAIAERERLEALHLAAIKKTDASEFGAPENKLADEEQEEACHAVSEFELNLLAIQPITAAGACAFLRFVARYLHSVADKGECVDAIRNAFDVLEHGEACVSPSKGPGVEMLQWPGRSTFLANVG
jgi:hypothetical protein